MNENKSKTCYFLRLVLSVWSDYCDVQSDASAVGYSSRVLGIMLWASVKPLPKHETRNKTYVCIQREWAVDALKLHSYSCLIYMKVILNHNQTYGLMCQMDPFEWQYIYYAFIGLAWSPRSIYPNLNLYEKILWRSYQPSDVLRPAQYPVVDLQPDLEFEARSVRGLPRKEHKHLSMRWALEKDVSRIHPKNQILKLHLFMKIHNKLELWWKQKEPRVY